MAPLHTPDNPFDLMYTFFQKNRQAGPEHPANTLFRAVLIGLLLFTTASDAAGQSTARWVTYQQHDGSTIRLEAGADTDGDGIDNELEINGFVFDLASGELVLWDGDPSKRYFFTDPLRASTDGDPYSDLMEVTGANMPGSIRAPYNHPLVAARPIIAVYMTSYEVIPNGEITDEEGGSITDAFTNETTNEDQFGVGVDVEVSLNPLELASVNASYDYSHTLSRTQSTTRTDEFNWNTARAVSESEAARLRLNVYYVNLGSAPASNVRPTFSLKLGNKVIATFQSSLNSEAQTLAPGGRFPANGSIAIDSYVAGEVDRDIVLSLQELKAIERGAPLSIVVPQVEARILRWNEATQSFSNEITWADYEQDIDPVSITLETNIGGKSAQYQVYTGSPQFQEPQRNLRETLELLFDVEERGGVTFIEGRRYPEFWYFATDSEELLDAKADLGENGDMLDLPMHRGNRLVMLSPGDDAAPAVDNSTYSRSMQYIYASARPIDGFPITRAVASLYQEERILEVPLEALPGSAFISNVDPIEEIYYGGFVTVYNARGDARVEELASPGRVAAFRSCGELPTTNFGRHDIALTGTLDALFATLCRYDDTGVATMEEPWTSVPEEAQGIIATDAVYAVSPSIALRATQTPNINAIQRSTDGGRTWSSPAQPTTSGRIRAFDFVDERKGFAVGGEGNIWRTLDAGDTWLGVPQPYTLEPLLGIDFLDDQRGLIVGGGGTLLQTTDGGQTWVPITVSAPGSDIADYGRLTFNDVQYVASETIAITTFDAILMSYDGGTTWDFHVAQDIAPSETCCVAARDVQFPTRSTGYFTAGFSPRKLFKSTDGGRSWQWVQMPVDGEARAVHFFDAENGIVVGGERIYHTTDGGRTWLRQRATNLPGIFYEEIHFNDRLGILGGVDDDLNSYVFHTTLVSTDYTVGPGGEPFSLTPKKVLRYDGLPHQVNGAGSLDEAAAILAGYDYVILGDPTLRSGEHRGTMFNLVNHPALEDTEVYMAVDVGVTTENLQGTDLAIAIVEWSHVFLRNMGRDFGVDRARQNEALRWAFGNGSKVVLEGDPDELFSPAADAVFNPNGDPLAIDETVFYLYDNFLVDAGGFVDRTAWRAMSDKVHAYSDAIGFRVLATTSGQGAYDEEAFHFAWYGSLLDGLYGMGWGEAGYGAGTHQAPFRARPDVAPGRAFFSDVRVDGAIVRRQLENGEVSLDFTDNTYRFGASTVSTEEPDGAEIPRSISLMQNYPNPFAGATTIPYELDRPGPIRLDIFDVLGRRVATLIDGEQPAGRHTVDWDAGGLAGGMYLYRIVAEGRSETRRMILVK